MPQFDFSTFASQIFWLMVTFFLLYGIMARRALPRIREVLQERQERISGDIEKAELIKKEAEAAKLDYTSVLVNSRAKAKQVISEVESQIKRETAERHSKLDETLARQMAEAEALVTKTREETLQKLIPVSAELTQYVLEKLAAKKVDLPRIQAVITSLAQEKNSVAEGEATEAGLRRFA